ncbi:hypothetical protein [Microbacterium sp. A1-JK]|uniref:hypothetical protein n=1 Tax=Microbacterium sp. A1-JK TaxID=3177516 RepID=UPI0038849648
MSSWTKTRSRIAHAKRADPNADVTDLKLQLKEERLAEYIQRIVDSAPPLAQEQRDRLAAIMRAGGAE